MKYSSLILFLYFAVSKCIFAYDFKCDYYSNSLYFKITSEKDASIHTCVITFSDSVEIEGVVKYNQNCHYNDRRIIAPDHVVYDNVKYIVTGLGDHAFQDTDIKYFEFFDYDEYPFFYVGEESFKNCTSLEKIFLNCTKFKGFGTRCFEYCTSLDSIFLEQWAILIPDGIEMGTQAFHGCSSLNLIKLGVHKPSDFRFGENVFDMEDGVINCTLMTELEDRIPLFKATPPWCYFTSIVVGGLAAPTTKVNSLLTPDRDSASDKAVNLRGIKAPNDVNNDIYIKNGKKYIIQ